MRKVQNFGSASLQLQTCNTTDPSPSEADSRLTRRLSEGSRILQIQMLDHVIVGASAPGRSGYFSFKEAGILP
jgi:DNA repair protein RadC